MSQQENQAAELNVQDKPHTNDLEIKLEESNLPLESKKSELQQIQAAQSNDREEVQEKVNLESALTISFEDEQVPDGKDQEMPQTSGNLSLNHDDKLLGKNEGNEERTTKKDHEANQGTSRESLLAQEVAKAKQAYEDKLRELEGLIEVDDKNMETENTVAQEVQKQESTVVLNTADLHQELDSFDATSSIVLQDHDEEEVMEHREMRVQTSPGTALPQNFSEEEKISEQNDIDAAVELSDSDRTANLTELMTQLFGVEQLEAATTNNEDEQRNKEQNNE